METDHFRDDLARGGSDIYGCTPYPGRLPFQARHTGSTVVLLAHQQDIDVHRAIARLELEILFLLYSDNRVFVLATFCGI